MTSSTSPGDRPVVVSIKTRQQHATWPQLRRFWRAADDLPVVAGGWVYDHLLPILGGGAGPVLEGWTTLSALAASTRRLRLGVMVSGGTYRNPALLVKMATSLDVISDGRVDIGLGAGWNEEEHVSFGFRFPPVRERMDGLDDACRIVTEMRRAPGGATVTGAEHHVRDAVLDPPPTGPLRLVVGGRGERRTMRAAARFADGWNLPAGTPDELRHKVGVLHAHAADAGRDPAEVEVSVQVDVAGQPARATDRAREMVAAGAQHVVFVFDAPLDLDPLHGLVDELGTDAGGGRTWEVAS